MCFEKWLEDEKPREKLMRQGVESLSDTELLAIFLRTGAQGKNVMALSRDLLTQFGSLEKLLSSSLNDFSKIKGVGLAKYAQLQAILELSRRAAYTLIKNKNIIRHAHHLKNYFKKQLSLMKQEVFACLFLNTRNHILAFEKLFFGSISHANVHPRRVVERALFHNAAHIVFAHNHPSGHAEPSQADIHLTKRLNDILFALDINLLDHFIVGNGTIFSLREHGLI